MIFNKKKGEELTLEQLREKYPEDYKNLMDAAKEAVLPAKPKVEEVVVDPEKVQLVKENAELKAANERVTLDKKIKEYGGKLGVDKEATQCIEQRSSLEDSLIVMVDAHANYLSNVKKSFDDTSSAQAGTDTQPEKTETEPKTFHEAQMMIKKRDDCSLMVATEKAQVEYKELFDANYEGLNKI